MSKTKDGEQLVRLFTVTDAFLITHRGLVLSPGPSEHLAGFRIGASLKLVRPDGSIIRTTLRGIAMTTPQNILVEDELAKLDVPLGTIVWLEA